MTMARTMLALGAILLLSGCASNQQSDEGEITDPGFYGERAPNVDFMDVYDPWEGFNRRVYFFNRYADRYVLLPLVRGYRFITPKFARTGVTNFWRNLEEVEVVASSLLQLKFKKAVRSTGRFAINTTVGLLGVMDVATQSGIDPVNEDLGQAMGHWGIKPGPYLVLPFLGPSSVRDGVGLAGEHFLSLGVNLGGVAEERAQNPALGAFFAISRREAVPFEYGQMKSPFEYEMVRFAVTEAREILVQE